MSAVVKLKGPGKVRKRLGQVNVDKVSLAHGGGGKAMRDLIDDVFVSAFDNATLAPLEDQARISLHDLAQLGDRLAFTTDSYVVDPLQFPGGDIGKLAVCGTWKLKGPGKVRKRLGQVNVDKVSLAHGGGGKAMRDLIDDVFVSAFDNATLAPLEDQARISLHDLAQLGDRLAFTTDSYVVDPLQFPGGDIGKLAVCGTVNDLAVGGAKPLYLSCSVIIEEGLEIETLRKIARSMAETAKAAGVAIVTGDTKVVDRGACDKVFMNTTGIGVIRQGVELGAARARPGDAVLVNGLLGDHGACILNARGDMALSTPVKSDCAALHELVDVVLAAAPDTRFLRDATRGGLATVLNEIALASDVSIEILEEQTPIREVVKGFCEILGLDPLYLANEGKMVCVVPDDQAAAALSAMQSHALGKDAAKIGHVVADKPGRVVMQTTFGGRRIVDMLVGEQLPRIC